MDATEAGTATVAGAAQAGAIGLATSAGWVVLTAGERVLAARGRLLAARAEVGAAVAVVVEMMVVSSAPANMASMKGLWCASRPSVQQAPSVQRPLWLSRTLSPATRGSRGSVTLQLAPSVLTAHSPRCTDMFRLA